MFRIAFLIWSALFILAPAYAQDQLEITLGGPDSHGNRLAWGTGMTGFGYMAGEYWAARRAQHGVYAHIWLTVFKGQAAPQNQIHDFHPPISPEGMYWVVPVPEGGLRFSPDGKTATLVMKKIPTVDQPKWPSLDAIATHAFLDHRLAFKAENDPAHYEDASRWYRFTAFKASAQLEAKVRVPSIGFEFETDALETSKADFSVMGEEVNGKYYGWLLVKVAKATS